MATCSLLVPLPPLPPPREWFLPAVGPSHLSHLLNWFSPVSQVVVCEIQVGGSGAEPLFIGPCPGCVSLHLPPGAPPLPWSHLGLAVLCLLSWFSFVLWLRVEPVSCGVNSAACPTITFNLKQLVGVLRPRSASSSIFACARMLREAN